VGISATKEKGLKQLMTEEVLLRVTDEIILRVTDEILLRS
jgi:hypothetical protein